MEFLTAPLVHPVKGSCSSCNKEHTNLSTVVMQIQDDPRNRNALNEPIKDGVTAHLICGTCADTHPLWGRPKQPEPEGVTA